MLYSRVVSAAEGLYVLGVFFTVFRNVFSVWPQKISLASLTIAHCWIMPSLNSFSQEGSLKREPWVCLFFSFASLFQSQTFMWGCWWSLSLSLCGCELKCSACGHLTFAALVAPRLFKRWNVGEEKRTKLIRSRSAYLCIFMAMAHAQLNTTTFMRWRWAIKKKYLNTFKTLDYIL